MTHYYHSCLTPVGRLHLISDEQHLSVLAFDSNWPVLRKHYPDAVTAETDVSRLTARELEDYFAGTGQLFTVPLRPRGTMFQLQVWDALKAIPYGTTASYGTQAARIKRPTASRAVGHANGQNPISILVPCHRVIGGSGALTGYAGGLAAKRFLLAHEQQVLEKLTSAA
ncbi:methylated-DNA--[protein]-cysteine S-methyltransferase [Govanella unica]|uniref:Methylated-DNA--protein-cysteine methyltransferase n=1 Tax=Govanella unica TaxID=2975056 RepID=A0A9X3Z676_9PROT|nr:methylated-DNA--[protein]-cysteine S-methyltransferase [Govania unica]MDA5192841.1 methylated-DNA--[protein]-cysteine S-methyltransferase [Govania unica]